MAIGMQITHTGAIQAMTPLQKLALRASEIRTRMAEISGLEGDALTDEIRSELSELRTEYADVETRTQAAIVAGDVQDPDKTETRSEEDDKLVELRGQVRLSNYVAAAMEQRAPDGAEAEYNSELGLKAGGAFPLELLAPAEIRQADGETETRATTDTDTTKRPSRWLDRLFADTMASRLGITFESVEPGIPTYPITTGGAVAAQRAREEAAGDAAWTVGVSELKPKRNAVRAVFTEEDAMRLPTLEDALRRDLNMALMEGVDRAIFTGDDGSAANAADITGLTTADITEVDITQENKVKGPETLAAFLGLVDGIHAGGLADLRTVATVGAYRLWEQTIANPAAENQTVASFLRAAGLSWGVRGGIENATADGDFGAFVGRGRGIEGAAVSAVWNSGMLIRDPYSGAAKGEVALTLSYFWDFGLPRPANFARVKFAA